VDATCPKVKKAQIVIHKQAAQNKHLLLFGERDHPEVRGLVSYAPEYTIFESLEELQAMAIAPDPDLFLAAQTTQDRESFNAIRAVPHHHIDAGYDDSRHDLRGHQRQAGRGARTLAHG
jgi:4-hydroxy-3-methylbut-2-en-1-yl diphosphate reductase